MRQPSGCRVDCLDVDRCRGAAPARPRTCILKPAGPVFAIFSHRFSPFLASSHPQSSTGCSSSSSSSSSMQPEAGLRWAGEGGSRSYLGRTHSICPSSGGVAGTFPPRYPGTAGTFVSSRAAQISTVPARWAGWAGGPDNRRREAAPGQHAHPCSPKDGEGHFAPRSVYRWPSLTQRHHRGGRVSMQVSASSEEAPDRHVAFGQSRDRPGDCDCDCRSLRPVGTLVVRYIRTWLEVLLNATTCRRSGPTQGSQPRVEQSRRSRVYKAYTL